MGLWECHVHTRFSSDSEEAPERVVERALEAGATGVCFTDHNDFGWFADEKGEVPFQLKFDEYVPYMRKVQKEFEGRIDVLIGVEQGLGTDCSQLVNEYDSHGELDFIIGSSHLVNGQDPYDNDFWVGKDIGKAILSYYESIVDNIGVCSNFDVYGHLDYVARYIPDKSYRYDVNDYMEIIEFILRQLIDKGKGIELNTAGLRYGMGAPNPDLSVLKLYRELGGEIITVGSDAHKADDVAFYQALAHEYLCNAGFKYYTVFKKREANFLRL